MIERKHAHVSNVHFEMMQKSTHGVLHGSTFGSAAITAATADAVKPPLKASSSSADLWDIDDEGSYSGCWSKPHPTLPNPTLPRLFLPSLCEGTATQVNQFIHSVAVWGHDTPAVRG